MDDLFHYSGSHSVRATSSTDVSALRQAERERDLFFNVALDMMCIANVDGYFVRVNSTFTRVLGWSEADLLTRPLLDFVHPDDHAPTLNEMAKLAAGIPTISFENRYQCRDGSYKWLSWTAAPSVEEQRIYGIARDITAQKQAAERLRRLQHMTVALAEALTAKQVTTVIIEQSVVVLGAAAGVVRLISDDGQYLEQIHIAGVSDATAKAWMRLPLTMVMPSTDAIRTQALVIQESFAEFAAQYPHLAPLAREMGHAASVAAPLIVQGRAVGVVSWAFGTPRTFNADERAFLHTLAQQCAQALERARLYEAERAEQQRADQARALLDTLITASPVGMTFLNRENRYELINDSLAEINGLPPADHIGRTLREVLPALADDLEVLFRQVRETGKPIIGLEVTGETPAAPGVQRAWITSYYPVRLANGEVIGTGSVAVEITERKRAEKTLREGEERLRVALDVARLGTWSWNPARGQVFADARCCEICGLDPTVVLALDDVAQRVHPDDWSRVQAALQAALSPEGSGSYAEEFRFVHANGTARWVIARGQTIFEREEQGSTASPRFAVMLGSVIDITERKQAEAALRERDEQLRLAVESAQFGSWDFNPQTGALWWSDECKAMFGVSATTEITYDMFLASCHADDQQRLAEAVQCALDAAHGGAIDVEYRTVGLEDGIERWLETKGQAYFDAQGRATRLIGLVRDISTQKHNEQEMERLYQTEQEARWRQTFLAEASKVLAASLDHPATLDNIGQLVVPHLADWFAVDLKGGDGSIELVSVGHVDPAKVQWGWDLRRNTPMDPNIPSGVPNVIRTGQAEFYPLITDAMLVASARNEAELALLRQIGYHSVIIVPLIARGRTLGAVTLIMAESQRVYTEDDVALAEELAGRCAQAIDNARLYRVAQEAVQVRDTFLSIASHELKTPLTSLLGNAQLLERRLTKRNGGDAREQRNVQVITEQAIRLNKMIGTLLDISRIQSGQLTITRTPLDLGVLARRLVEELRSTLTKHTLVLEEHGVPLPIIGDELRLEQVLQNLVQNAVKYSPDGGSVAIALAQQGDTARLTVRDEGIGIPTAALPNLFQRFYRAENAAAQQIAGMGIGLYVVREIVERHGGRIEVASTEGTGSTFTVVLPLDTGARGQELEVSSFAQSVTLDP